MQLVIEISDGLYNNLDTIKNGSIASKIILDCVRKGQVLPKGHGDLIDVDTIVWDEEYEMASDDSYIVVRTPIIDTAITAIKADKED